MVKNKFIYPKAFFIKFEAFTKKQYIYYVRLYRAENLIVSERK